MLESDVHTPDSVFDLMHISPTSALVQSTRKGFYKKRDPHNIFTQMLSTIIHTLYAMVYYIIINDFFPVKLFSRGDQML